VKEIIIIAAMSENRVIGKNNNIPWLSEEFAKKDLARFKELTTGWPCIMGRKTWESLPKRPLPNRPNIIVSQSLESVSGATVFPSLQKAIEHCDGYQKVFICGGASIYSEALELANKMELTLIHKLYNGDVFFPEIDPAQWEKTASADFDGFSFISYNKLVVSDQQSKL